MKKKKKTKNTKKNEIKITKSNIKCPITKVQRFGDKLNGIANVNQNAAKHILK